MLLRGYVVCTIQHAERDSGEYHRWSSRSGRRLGLSTALSWRSEPGRERVAMLGSDPRPCVYLQLHCNVLRGVTELENVSVPRHGVLVAVVVAQSLPVTSPRCRGQGGADSPAVYSSH